MKNWSKLQKELYKIIDTRIGFQIHCTAYRMQSRYGSVSLPRYFITLGKEILFDYPKQFVRAATEFGNYPYENSASKISDLIREYIDTPVAELFEKTFQNDDWNLTEIFKAADRRFGRKRLQELSQRTNSEAAKEIIEKRSSFVL